MLNDLEARLERVKEDLAARIPGYLGYRDRERRRDADKQLRMELARQFDAQRTRLLDLQQRAVNRGLIEALDDLERVNLKLQHFIDRLRTASYGYAGWFETASVQEPELEQLYAFDRALAGGVDRVAQGMDAVSQAVTAGRGIEEAAEALGRIIDELNHRFDQRRDLLAAGKKVPPTELQEALEVPATPSPILQALSDLKPDDALSYEGVDYLVVARVMYDERGHLSFAYRLEDGGAYHWLRVPMDRDAAVYLYDEVEFDTPVPPAETVELEGVVFRQTTAGKARAYVVGPGGRRQGVVDYWLYEAPTGEALWIERWGEELRAHRGMRIDVERLQVWPRGR
jgi:hypothetical protein